MSLYAVRGTTQRKVHCYKGSSPDVAKPSERSQGVVLEGVRSGPVNQDHNALEYDAWDFLANEMGCADGVGVQAVQDE